MNPRREPGQIVLEKVSIRITRPSVSNLRYEGTSDLRKSSSDSACLGSLREDEWNAVGGGLYSPAWRK